MKSRNSTRRRRNGPPQLRGWLSGKQLALVGLILPLVRIGWRLALAGNSRPLSGIGRVGFGPSRRTIVAIGDDRLGRALRFAHAAINALARVDDEHVFAGIEAVNWADFDAIHVLAANEVLGDYVGHGLLLSSWKGGHAYRGLSAAAN